MKISFFFLLLFILGTSCAQKPLDGLWFSSYHMNIQKRTESFDFSSGKTTQLKEDRIDTFYQELQGIIDFLPNKNAVVKGLGNKESSGIYSIMNDTISLQLDSVTMNLVEFDDHLLLVDLDSGWQKNQVVFERIEPKSTLELTKINFIDEPYWVFNTDSNSQNYGLEILIVDSVNLIISQFTNYYAETTLGEYKTDRYKNNLFLYFIDLYHFEENFFRLYDRNLNIYKAQSFEFETFGDAPPMKRQLTFENQSLPEKKKINAKRKILTGSWHLGAKEPFKSEFSEYDSTENEFFNLTLDKNTFNIEYGAHFYKGKKKELLIEEIKGTWKMGMTGKFLELTYSNGEKNYLTISSMSKQILEIHISLKTPDSDHLYRSSRIQLKK